MSNQHPPQPLQDLVSQWREEAPKYRDCGVGRENWLMERAAQWGYEQARAAFAMDSKLTVSEQRAVVGWVGDHIDTNKALRSWRDKNRGGLLMAEVHTVQPGERSRTTSEEN